jgi:hypothetical protein
MTLTFLWRLERAFRSSFVLEFVASTISFRSTGSKVVESHWTPRQPSSFAFFGRKNFTVEQ